MQSQGRAQTCSGSILRYTFRMCKNEELQGQGGVEICLESAEPDSVEAVTALPLDCRVAASLKLYLN
jgi:hypothetical protein